MWRSNHVWTDQPDIEETVDGTKSMNSVRQSSTDDQ